MTPNLNEVWMIADYDGSKRAVKIVKIVGKKYYCTRLSTGRPAGPFTRAKFRVQYTNQDLLNIAERRIKAGKDASGYLAEVTPNTTIEGLFT